MLIFLFHSKKKKKNSGWTHRELQKVYGSAALVKQRAEFGSVCFKDGDFNVDDRPRKGRPKTFEVADWRHCSMRSVSTARRSCFSIKSHPSIHSKRLHALGMIQKRDPYDLKPRDVERRFFSPVTTALATKKEGVSSSHRDGWWKSIHYSSPKKRNHGEYLDMPFTSSPWPNIHAA